MEEIIVQIARTIACFTRLRILSLLARAGEVSPTRLATDLHIPIAQVSAHLRRLSAAGLILRRRSGTWCYCVSQSPYSEHALSGKVASWLFSILKSPAQAIKYCRLAQVCNFGGNKTEEALHTLIFEAATAFTNVRRLQILRWLWQRKEDAFTPEVLSQRLSMSESAVCRHMAKLIRRGYVTTMHTKRPLGYRLSRKFKTPIHVRLFHIVSLQWKKS